MGIGDIGKMGRKDDISKGSPITMKAVEFILERSESHAGKPENMIKVYRDPRKMNNF